MPTDQSFEELKSAFWNARSQTELHVLVDVAVRILNLTPWQLKKLGEIAKARLQYLHDTELAYISTNLLLPETLERYDAECAIAG